MPDLVTVCLPAAGPTVTLNLQLNSYLGLNLYTTCSQRLHFWQLIHAKSHTIEASES